jgi:hypothetical protein
MALPEDIAARLNKGMEHTPLAQVLTMVFSGAEVRVDLIKDFDSESLLAMLTTFMLNSVDAFNRLASEVEELRAR